MKALNSVKYASLVGLLAASLVGVGTAASATEGGPPSATQEGAYVKTAESAEKRLPSGPASLAAGFSDKQKQRVGEILADPEFGVSGSAKSIQNRYPEVEVEDTVVDDTGTPSVDSGQRAAHDISATSAKNGNKTKSLKTNWKILGVSYAEIKTTMSFNVKDWRIKKINSCYGTIVNYIPLRQTDKHNTSQIKSGKATCITNVTLARPAQKTVSGKHGFTANADGKMTKTWVG
ncbi:hypothetical protein [Brevibacterium aurantiacum]|uniref:Secreted protein n=2 Tax=Brevibacterium aurantiacum TaxID=273384 RepID=A0A2A3X0L2_BREAU|nr:hypothetical protein [Brevibacterium aurantiacum]MDN5586746.1 hypothetical protein [Brevibacterium sp.]AZL06291.1 hypothetical protein CXR24_12410 [Brevibacterium aurantiacum]AZL09848.1 hypothetical protein CXR26_11935 [Brevibacterium aurantiacum]AZL13498.1 hypothetical protein CXR25_12275 [Brevibacterium aurantiacum]AZT97811.1 hypothetical protein CXR27_13010 [Brevibacterium aurantiacum]